MRHSSSSPSRGSARHAPSRRESKSDAPREYPPETGKVCWYDSHKEKLASGERCGRNDLTAAHKTLPFGTVVRVTRTDNGRAVEVRINDRGPFVRGRIIDVSRRAARELDLIDAGVAPCRVEVLQTPGG